MKYLLDTDTLSFVAREANEALMSRVRSASLSDLAMSLITRGEIEFGLLAQPPRRQTLERMQGLLSNIQTLPMNLGVAKHYAHLRTHLTRAGTPIGSNDMWIAAQALDHALVVVTHNEREFRRVPGLAVENWLL